MTQDQFDEVVRDTIAEMIWEYNECPESFGKIWDAQSGMGEMMQMLAVDQAELIRARLQDLGFLAPSPPTTRASRWGCFRRLFGRSTSATGTGG